MKKNKKNSKRKYEQRKKGKKILKFLKEYSAVIMIAMSVLAFISNGIIWYYQKANSTEFSFSYLTVFIDSDDWVKTYIEKNGENALYSDLVSPTINNSIQQLLYKNPDKLMGYYVTYLIVTQTGETDASNVTLHFKQYGKEVNISQNELSDFKISKQSNSKIIYKKIQYPFPEGEQIKVPISICKADNYYAMKSKTCYYIQLEPISIEYENKYLFSKRNEKIRPYSEENVIIDGEMVTGKGSADDISDTNKPWYLK